MTLPERLGHPPLVSVSLPVEQLTQSAPARVQEWLARLLGTLPGVQLRPSFVCVQGTRACHLSPTLAHGPVQAFLAGTEFAHLHPPYDGSLHLMLPPPLAAEVARTGWGTPAQPPGSLLVYGPRDDDEAEVVGRLVLASYRYACAQDGVTEDGRDGPQKVSAV